ncbi:MAG: hypothetical protein JW889_04310 [Verrucomicrobia bacterium]|nr:hypothetical protein [Verrucomicrobiota bacterium]
MSARVFWTYLALVAALAIVLPAAAQFEERTVVAGGEGESKNEAVSRALRAAVEQGVGVLISSETLVENNTLISDRIYSEVSGYVSTHEVLEDNGGEGGLWEVKVRATVSLARLREDLAALRLLIEEKENPRIAILCREYVDGGELPAPVLQTALEQFFLGQEFDVVDVAQLEKIKEREATLHYDDPIEAAALGRRFGADVLVLGEASAELGGVREAHGLKVYSYTANITLKAVKTDTAKVIAVVQGSHAATGGGAVTGEGDVAREALKGAAGQTVEKLMDKIVQVWHQEVYNVENVEIVLFNATTEEQKAFIEGLKSIDGVQKVTERMVEETTAAYDVLVAGAIKKDLADKVLAIDEPKLTLRGKTPNRIRVVVEDE